jgi:hypothetical protein
MNSSSYLSLSFFDVLASKKLNFTTTLPHRKSTRAKVSKKGGKNTICGYDGSKKTPRKLFFINSFPRKSVLMAMSG